MWLLLDLKPSGLGICTLKITINDKGWPEFPCIGPNCLLAETSLSIIGRRCDD